MWMAFKCGCERDIPLTEKHHKGDDRSAADVAQGNHHFPQGRGPGDWCVACSSERPCECDAPKQKQQKSNPKKKGSKR